MDMAQKVSLGIAGIGIAFVTGAAVQSHISDKEEKRQKMRDKICDLETKSREQTYEIEELKAKTKRMDDNLDEVKERVYKIEREKTKPDIKV